MAYDKGRAGGILGYFARHRTAANLVLVLMLASGLYAIPQMRAQFFPDVVSDEIDITVAWDGAGAEDVDNAIVGLMQPALAAVEGVDGTEARSSEGRASLEVQFEPGWDMSRAEADVQQALDGITNLPDGADDPTIRRGTWFDRVTDVVITGPVGVDQLGRFADEMVERLFAEGVTATSVTGIAAPQTVVEVTSLSLIRNDITMSEIADAIAANADADPAGDVAGSARVRTGSERRSADQIAGIALRSEADGTQLTIGDVATVRTEGIDRERASFVGENPAIQITVNRSARGDAIAIQRSVEEVAAEMELGLPEGVQIDLIRTRAEQITGRLNILLSNGAMGLVLVVALLFLFLNARTAFWVAAGIPVSMTAAIAVMWAAGLTFNMISLFALIITLGIVVDDAIVVGEHADFRARRLGEPPDVAAENAARRMFLPVFSSTVTTVIAFWGLVIIGGRFGDLISDIPFTVIAVLLASLVECFVILPNHMRHALMHTAEEHWYDYPSRQVNRGFRWVRDRLFRPMMAGVIRARYPVLAGAILALASQAVLFINGDVQWRFFSSPEQSSLSANYAMAPGATREDTLAQLRLLQATVDAVGDEYEAEHGADPFAYVMAEIGGNTGRGLSGADQKEPDQLGSLAIELIDADLRPYSSYEVVSRLQDEVQRHPLLETLSFQRWGSGPGGDSLSVQLSGATTPVLKQAAERLKGELARYGEVSAVEDSLAYDKSELVLDLTAQGQALGIDIDGLGTLLRQRLAGIEAATFPDGPRTAAIRVELPDDELTADFLDRTQIRTASGDYVPLADIVTVETREGFSTIRRENGIRLVSVTGEISEDDPARATEIMDELATVVLPQIEAEYGVATELAGLAADEDEFLSDALLGLMLSLLGIYLTLAWVFSSWTRPIVVMSIIPFGLVGAIWGHAAWDVPMSMFSIVGLIGMVGIIINDSIVLVTTIDDYAEERGLFPAIVDGTADRLRPVFLTTATTVLGLAPLLYERSEQAQFLKPTVVTLVYGLGFGMVLVLLVVPALMAMQHDVARNVAAVRRALRPKGRKRAGVAVVALGLALAGWFAATLGAEMATGAMAGPLAGLGGAGAALGLFLLGAFVLTMLALGIATALAAGRVSRSP